MLTYKMSRREKALVLVFAIILVAVAWFVFVYQNTTDQITKIEGELSTVQSQTQLMEARASQIDQMKAEIEQRKAEGAKPVEVPEYDNIQPLMAQLNRIMSAAASYSLSFDDLDTSNAGYVARGVRIDYESSSYEAAESIVDALAAGKYPCRVDTISINDKSTKASSSKDAPVSASVHVTFFEKTS
jgi:hypothetical protein